MFFDWSICEAMDYFLSPTVLELYRWNFCNEFRSISRSIYHVFENSIGNRFIHARVPTLIKSNKYDNQILSSDK